MIRRLWLAVAPLMLASSVLLISPAPAAASGGMTETGTTTYEVLPDKSQIKVTIKLTIANHKPDSNGKFYYWDYTYIAVEKEAGAVTATSNAGRVSQKVHDQSTYYKILELDYPQVLYGQTRTVTATYTIPAAPKSPGGFRALSAYVSLCAVGNGEDTGAIQIVIPSGFELYVDDGSDMTKTADANGKETWSTGTQSSPYELWTCVDAENAAKLTTTDLSASSHPFTIRSWPEDKTWATDIKADIVKDVAALEELTGLKLPDKRVTISEAGAMELGDYGGMYNYETRTAYIPETIDKPTVAHELSHIWFNGQLFHDKWMSEGLAGFSEQVAGAGNYKPCTEPGKYPGTGSPDLTRWVTLGAQPTKQDEATLSWEYDAACYVFTSLSSEMGPDNFRNVLVAAQANTMAYQGATPDEVETGGSPPLSAKQLLDIVDEVGMVPAGVTDLDKAGDLLAGYGVFTSGSLADRSKARAAYHKLVTAAGKWKLPLSVRQPMENWDFSTATTAMQKVGEVLAARDQLTGLVKGLTLDGSQLQTDFEAATLDTDLDPILATIQKEIDAAKVVAKAGQVHDANRTFFQTIGLMGQDVDGPLDAARKNLTAIKPDAARAEAQSVIDAIDSSGSQGTLRAGVAGGAAAILLVLLILAILIVRRKPTPVPAVQPFAAPPGMWPPQPPSGPGIPGQPFAPGPPGFGQSQPTFGQSQPTFGQSQAPAAPAWQSAPPPVQPRWQPPETEWREPRPPSPAPPAPQAPTPPTPPRWGVPNELPNAATPNRLVEPYDPYAHLDSADEQADAAGQVDDIGGWEMPGLADREPPKDPFGR